MGQEQAGFRECYSTIDHTFVLKLIIELYQSVPKLVCCAFIDYRKAFDSINRPLLWQKLLFFNINGKLFNVVKNMYDKAKSCVKIENLYSDYFPCNIGVRQGDNLSPLLFALFINDFSHYVGRSYKGLCVSKSCYPSLENEDALFLKLFVLLYADDTIILAKNERDLQTALDSVQEFCTKFKLIVNINKTKIIIFSRGKARRFTTVKYGCDIIEVVSDYVYLGVKMNFENTFANAMKKQLDQGRRAQFSMLIKARNLDLPIDIQTKLFESIVCPILLYGSEVWGYKEIDMLEIFHRKFSKNI